MPKFEGLRAEESFGISIPAIDETFVGDNKPFRIDLALTIPAEKVVEAVEALRALVTVNAFQMWEEVSESGVNIRMRFADQTAASQSYVDIMLLLDPNFATQFAQTIPVDPAEAAA